MKKLYYGIEDKDGKVPGNLMEEGELKSSFLIPAESLSDVEKPGMIEIKKDMKDDPLEKASEIDPSEYIVKKWDDGKAKRIYSGLIGSLQDDWKDISTLEVNGKGEIYADGEKIKGEFTTTHGSTVLIKDVQDVTEQTDQKMENEYFNCIHCDKELKSYMAIEKALPKDWNIDTDDKRNNVERRDDGSIVLNGICPDCTDKRSNSEE